MRTTIAFIGVGNMGAAILRGILNKHVFLPEHILVCDTDDTKCRPFTEQGCIYTPSIEEAVSKSDCILLAIKPQQMNTVLSSITDLTEGKLIISIAAGIPTERIESTLTGASVVRVMPNTPLQVNEGVSAICRGSTVSDSDYALACSIFTATGMTVELPENMINAVTALTSSSIAYFARFIGDMCAWAHADGFSDEQQTLDMVCRSAIGTAKLMMQSGFSPEQLETAVTSPNGTTERAMKVFTDRSLNQIVAEAMNACRDRADELSAQ